MGRRPRVPGTGPGTEPGGQLRGGGGGGALGPSASRMRAGSGQPLSLAGAADGVWRPGRRRGFQRGWPGRRTSRLGGRAGRAVVGRDWQEARCCPEAVGSGRAAPGAFCSASVGGSSVPRGHPWLPPRLPAFLCSLCTLGPPCLMSEPETSQLLSLSRSRRGLATGPRLWPPAASLGP